jgi:hypothetical protein
MLSKGLRSHSGKKEWFCKTNPTSPSRVVENRTKAPLIAPWGNSNALQRMRLGEPVLPKLEVHHSVW